MHKRSYIPFRTSIGLRSQRLLERWFRLCRLLIAVALLIAQGLPVTNTFAQSREVQSPQAGATTTYVDEIRTFEQAQLSLGPVTGITYSPEVEALITLTTEEAQGEATLHRVSLLEELLGGESIDGANLDPNHLAFDNEENRLLLFDPASQELLALPVSVEGELDQSTLVRTALAPLGLQTIRGMAYDPQRERLFLLDGSQPRLLSLQATPDGHYAQTNEQPAWIQLTGSDEADLLHGLALDPLQGHFFTINQSTKALYEFSETGTLIATRDLATLGITDPQGIVFAPSGDSTDDPAEHHLYLIDRQPEQTIQPTVQLTEQPTAEAGAHRLFLPIATGGPVTTFSSRIVELALTPPPILVTAAAVNTATLVQTIHTSTFSPPSPDAAGIAYINKSNRLLISDSEVNEMSIYAGANLFLSTVTGNLQSTATTLAYSKEPTGVAYNSNNDHLYISDDDGKKVYTLAPGADGQPGTSDDLLVATLNTRTFGSNDPEGVGFSSALNMLFIADGVNNEVYKVTPGADGKFDGINDEVTQFDTQALGILDPEGIEYNPDTGTLYIAGKSKTEMGEVTINGSLVQKINIAAAGALRPAGVAYGPSSQNPSGRSIYLADRGIDNDSNPTENDGKVFEFAVTGTPTPNNAAPVVNAGVDQTITLPATATLNGTVTDDGLPNPPAALTVAWAKVSGPGTVTFANAAGAQTTAGFSMAGAYVLRLTANDSQLSTADEVTIVVQEQPTGGGNTLDVRVAASADDAEEQATGSVSLSSSDLELVFDKSNQTVGIRFTNLTIPQGATITNAYVQFTVDETGTTATTLTFKGQAADNPPTFVSATRNISARPTTNAAVNWTPPVWNTVNAAGPDQRTPNLAAIVQEIVSRPGWTPGNALVLLVTGDGKRTARAYNGVPAAAPLLHVEFSSGGSGGANAAPVVNAGVDQTITLPATATLNGTTTDDGLPNPPAALTVAWAKVSGPGTVTFANAAGAQTTAGFSMAGAYVLRLTANDSQLSTADEVTIVVQEQPTGGGNTLDVRVAASADDAEEQATGSVSLSSSDLELVFDKSNQTVGIRFTNLTIPQGATITNAYVQFTVDETGTTATTLTFKGQAADNPPTFVSATRNISARPTTNAAVNWTPPVWNTVNAAGPDQRTPNLAAIVQEIVSRPGWTPGNALVLLVTGDGKRTARAYNGVPAAAPLLHVEYE